MRTLHSGLTALLGAVVVAVALPAHAADRSVDIEIVGIVPESCSISVDNSRAVFDLSTRVQQVRVATVTENCNRSAGYVVTVRSSQNGVLSSTGGGIGYGVTYGGQEVDLAGGSVMERNDLDGATPRDLLITVPEGDYAGGVYRDIITIEISAQ